MTLISWGEITMVCAFGWLIYWVRRVKEERRADDASCKLYAATIETIRKKAIQNGKMKEPNIWDEYLAEEDRKRETMQKGEKKKHGRTCWKNSR